jgi:hypothetical protein
MGNDRNAVRPAERLTVRDRGDLWLAQVTLQLP